MLCNMRIPRTSMLCNMRTARAHRTTEHTLTIAVLDCATANSCRAADTLGKLILRNGHNLLYELPCPLGQCGTGPERTLGQQSPAHFRRQLVVDQ
jgi:hypothetical protein